MCEREEPPRSIIVTHFHELFHNNLIPDRLGVKWKTMEIVEQDVANILFLYKYVNIFHRHKFLKFGAGLWMDSVRRAGDYIALDSLECQIR